LGSDFAAMGTSMLQRITRDLELLQLRMHAWEFRIKHIRELIVSLATRMEGVTISEKPIAVSMRVAAAVQRAEKLLAAIAGPHSDNLLELQEKVYRFQAQASAAAALPVTQASYLLPEGRESNAAKPDAVEPGAGTRMDLGPAAGPDSNCQLAETSRAELVVEETLCSSTT